jgi:hypothetical protein
MAASPHRRGQALAGAFLGLLAAAGLGPSSDGAAQPRPDVRVTSLRAAPGPAMVVVNETGSFRVTARLRLAAASPTRVRVRWQARVPQACGGSWVASSGGVLRRPLLLETRSVLPGGAVARPTRRFSFVCSRTGRFRIGLTARALRVRNETDLSDNVARASTRLDIRANFVPRQLLVAFRPGTGAAAVRNAIARHGTRRIRTFPSPAIRQAFPGARTVEWLRVVSRRTVPATIDRFARDPAVGRVEPNLLGALDGHQTLPNDLTAGEWGFLNAGQVIRQAAGIGTIDADVDAPQAWDLVRDCTSVVVAVADTGADLTHPDLHNPAAGVSNLWVNPAETPNNGRDDDANGLVNDVNGADFIGEDLNGNAVLDPREDDNGNGRLDRQDGDPTDPPNWAQGHGTAVAGIIGAIGNNGRGIAGACWRARIMSIRIMPRDGRPPRQEHKKGWTSAAFMSMVDYVVTQRLRGENVKVVNLSGSMVHPAQTPQLSVALLDAADILLVVSAGNRGGYDVDDREDVYRDADGSGAVSGGDRRLTQVTVGGTTFPAGSAVAGGHADVGRPLIAFAANELHTDPGGPGAFDPAESIYRDNPPLGRVAPGDVRLTAVDPFVDGSTVAGGDPDAVAGARLVPFAANEKHTEQGAANGAYDYRGAYPCVYPNRNVVCVAATDNQDQLASFSSVGATSVDLAAPGVATESLTFGGGTGPFSGTSAAAPHVAGIAALCWSVPQLAQRTDVEMKELILRFVDRVPSLQNLVVSEGRLKWPCSFDLGDAPNGYGTTSAEPLLDCDVAEIDGPVHLDLGNEWFGSDATTEHNANTPPPRDQDVSPNIEAAGAPACPAGTLVDADASDDGGFTYAPEPPWAAGATVTVTFTACSEWIDNPVAGVQVRDQGAGRYKPGDPDNRVYANFFLDINSSGTFDLPLERPALLPTNALTEFELPLAAAGAAPVFPPVTRCRPIKRDFVVPAPGGTPDWVRWRLDYGENGGANDPGAPPAGAPKFRADPRAPVAPVPSHLRIVQYGEVEDYPLEGLEKDEFPDSLAIATIMMPGGRTERIALTGPTTVEVKLRTLADGDGDGLEEVQTRMTRLDLSGMSPTLGLVRVRLSPTRPTLGEIEETRNTQPGRLDLPPFAPSGTATSFFDVFVEIEASGVVLHNETPKHMEEEIEFKPPSTPVEQYESPDVVELFTPTGQRSGFSLGSTLHIPSPGHERPPEGLRGPR